MSEVAQTHTRYRLLELLGRGAMGDVHLAQDLELSRHVAVKVLRAEIAANPSLMTRFRREAEIAARLSHANICTIFGFGETPDGLPFIAMEYIRGRTLQDVIERGGTRLDDILGWTIQIADALGEAHANGVIHRDIKPANVMITRRSRIKVLDFGLAQMTLTDGLGLDRDLADPGLRVGTVPYMSPEQTRGEEVDHRSDIFSLGIVLYLMVTGRLPFVGETTEKVWDAICRKRPRSPCSINGGIPPALEAIIDRALEKRPRKRYGSAGELMQDLLSVRRSRSRTDDGDAGAARRGGAGHSTVSRVGEGAGGGGAIVAGWDGVTDADTLTIWQRYSSTVDSYRGQRESSSDSAPPHRLAVLPFKTVGRSRSDRVLSQGLVETLSSKLTQLRGFLETPLWVVPVDDVRRRRVRSAADAYRKLGATRIISGSFQRFAHEVRLTLNLVDAVDVRQIRSAVVTCPYAEGCVLQDAIVTEVTAMLGVRLDTSARRVAVAGAAGSPRAYELYLEGRGHLRHTVNRRELDRAMARFTEAVAEDATFALGHAGLGTVCWRIYELSRETKWVIQALQHCERALELDDRLVEVHVTVGTVSIGTGLYEDAIRSAHRAIEIDPRSEEAYGLLARAYRHLARWDDADPAYRQAIRLGPTSVSAHNDFGSFLLARGRLPEAEDEFRQVVRLDPESYAGFNNLGTVHYIRGQLAAARKMFERAFAVQAGVQAASNLGTMCYFSGDYDAAIDWYRRALEFSPNDHILWGSLASAYEAIGGASGEVRNAFRRALRHAREQREINSRDPHLVASLAEYHAGLGENDRARELLDETIGMGVSDAQVKFIIGSTYERLGERRLALKWIHDALADGHPRLEVDCDPVFAGLRVDRRFKPPVTS